MIATKQAAWLFLAIISLACSGLYFARPVYVVKLDKLTLSTMTDMIANNLTIQQFDTQGHLAHSLHTPFMRHIPSKNTHVLTTPHISITQPTEATWEIDAETATAINGGEQMTFNKNVIVHQEKGEHSEESTFKTEEITYFPKEKIAKTKLGITFEQPGHHIEATGMTAYLAEKRVQLLSQAKGTYEPSHG